jgi:hypothetical protein
MNIIKPDIESLELNSKYIFILYKFIFKIFKFFNIILHTHFNIDIKHLYMDNIYHFII